MKRGNGAGMVWIFPVWLGALLGFGLVLGWALIALHAEPGREAAPEQGKSLALPAAPGPVLDALPAPGVLAAPVPPFAEDAKYVLAGAGLQGLYQLAAPDAGWRADSPAPELAVQLIRRGPPVPRLLREAVRVSWELEPQSGAPVAPRQGVLEPAGEGFFRARPPISAQPADGTTNPYPLIRLRASDAQGMVLAESAAVLAVSPGFGCAFCHVGGSAGFLRAHDTRSGTRLLAEQRAGRSVACRECHTGPVTEADGRLRAGRGLGLSAAVHGWHAPYLRDAGACAACHTDWGRSGQDGAPVPLFARDFHRERGLSCVRCHGSMAEHALALLQAEQEAGQPAAAALRRGIAAPVPFEQIPGRLAWVQQPDCSGCHDFARRPDAQTCSGFGHWTPRAAGRAGLYSERFDDMRAVRCVVCHGAPHALYPARNPLNLCLDNLPPLQYQGRAAALGARGGCVACHGEAMPFFAHHALPAPPSE